MVIAPIFIVQNYELPFELMYDVSDYTVGEVLSQHHANSFMQFTMISKVLNENQVNYITIEKELLAVVFALEFFCPYLIGSKVFTFIDHVTLKYLFTKGDLKPRLIRWTLLLQVFDLDIKDKKGVENAIANHLSRLDNIKVSMKENNITAKILDDHLMEIHERPWFSDMANYKAIKNVPKEYSRQKKKWFYKEENFYLWDE